MTGIGEVPVQVLRVRNCGANEDGAKIKFNSSLVPPYLRKAKSLKDWSLELSEKHLERRFQGGACCASGPDTEGPSSSTVMRMKARQWEEYEAWRKRNLKGNRYVYMWADGVYLGVGLSCLIPTSA